MILTYIEQTQGKIQAASLQALTLARGLAERIGAPLAAVIVGELTDESVQELGAFGVETLYRAEHAELREYAPAAYAQSVVEIMNAHQPTAVLAAASERGSEIMAHVAAKKNLPLAAQCTVVQANGEWLVTRLRWGGSLLEEAKLKGAPKLLTVAPDSVAAERAPTPRTVTVNPFAPTLSAEDLRVRVVERGETDAGKVSLGDARVVIGGGRGVGSAEGFGELEELAALLGGAVGGSRVVTGLGWRPHADQIGQTGNRIAPELYIACGISGAIQHMVGAKGAKLILAINTDAEAPIVSKADYAVIGDLHQVVPAISAEIKRRRESRNP